MVSQKTCALWQTKNVQHFVGNKRQSSLKAWLQRVLSEKERVEENVQACLQSDNPFNIHILTSVFLLMGLLMSGNRALETAYRLSL